MRTTPVSRWQALAITLLLLALPAGAARADFDESYDFDTQHLQVYNLIGEVRVEAASGSHFEVELHARGADADAGILDIEHQEGRTSRLTIGFPLSDSREYVYPRWDKRSSSQFSPNREQQKSWLKRLLGNDRVKVRGKGNRGTELYADLVIRVPKGAELEVFHGAGEILAQKVDGDLMLDSHVGAVRAEDIDGHLVADTGSGSIYASAVRGDVNADTGSGGIELIDIDGETVVTDTGSGSITLEDLRANKINADTGSGGVHIDGAQCSFLLVDTGSGRVDVAGLDTDGMSIDTGSGSVEVELVRAGDGKFQVDTGSGSIRLDVPSDFSARVSAETSSGGVSVAIDGIDVRHRERNEMQFTAGDGAARVELDAGSGSIRIASR